MDWYVVKTDSTGDLQWSRTFGGIYDDRAQEVVVTEEGEIVITGWMSGDTSRYQDVALVKLNSAGDSIWGRIYGGPRGDVAQSVVQHANGYVIAGFTGSYGAGGRDFWMLATSADGDSLWSRTFGGQGWDEAFSVRETADGGLVLAGSTASYGAGAYDMWLVRTNAEGDSVWSRTYGGGFDEVRDMQPTFDGGFILVGYTGSFGQGWENAWLVKTDSLGSMEWNHTYGNVEQVHAHSARQLPDGGFVVSGSYEIGTGDVRGWLFRTDSAGDSVWQATYRVGSHTGFNAVSLVDNRGYIVIGYTDGRGAGSYDAWMLRTATDPVTNRVQILPQQIALNAYPNPFNSTTTLTFSLPHSSPVTLSIFNLLGQAVYESDLGRLQAGEHRQIFDASGLPSGVYLARVEAAGLSTMQKMLLLK